MKKNLIVPTLNEIEMQKQFPTLRPALEDEALVCFGFQSCRDLSTHVVPDNDGHPIPMCRRCAQAYTGKDLPNHDLITKQDLNYAWGLA